MKWQQYSIAIVATIVVGTLAVVYIFHGATGREHQYPSIVDTATISALPQKDASSVDTSHLGNGLVAPTNKWFSGVVLQKTPQSIFPTPLRFTPTETAFTFDLPSVVTGSAAIMAGTRQPISVSIRGATHYIVTRYDELSIDLTYKNANQELGTVTVVAGLPYVYFYALNDTVLLPSGTPLSADGKLTYETNDITAVLATYDGAHVEKRTITAPKGSLVTMYAANVNIVSTVGNYAANRVESVSVDYKKEGDMLRTVINYKTSNGKPTYFGRLPHQQTNDSTGMSFETIYGSLVMEAGTELSFSTSEIPVLDSLDLSRLGQDERALLSRTVRQDINTPVTHPEDSYFGGKAMYRDAQLLKLAKELDETEVATTVQERLRNELVEWLDNNSTGSESFYYDTRLQGIVGVTPSFGSDAFNDHHFHFGYFLYAAGILAQYDQEFRTAYKNKLNLLVADIANYRTDEKLPLRRSFDPYFGHSWASGSAPFADGNNQESSSEAINAWVGIGLWARQIGNTDLADQAAWMLSNEVAATSKYWLDFDQTKAPYSNGYNHSLVALNWGGKRDYVTFFSADPRAMLGIQLLPMSPTMQYMKNYGGRIGEQLKEARTTSSPAQFDDYLLMYESLNPGSSGVLDRAKQLPDAVIDGANSRSYMYAWIMSR